MGYLSLGKVQKALELVGYLIPDGRHVHLYRAATNLCLEQGRLDEAKEVAERISSLSERSEMMEKIAKGYLAMNEVDKALQLISYLTPDRQQHLYEEVKRTRL